MCWPTVTLECPASFMIVNVLARDSPERVRHAVDTTQWMILCWVDGGTKGKRAHAREVRVDASLLVAFASGQLDSDCLDFC